MTPTDEVADIGTEDGEVGTDNEEDGMDDEEAGASSEEVGTGAGEVSMGDEDVGTVSDSLGAGGGRQRRKWGRRHQRVFAPRWCRRWPAAPKEGENAARTSHKDSFVLKVASACQRKKIPAHQRVSSQLVGAGGGRRGRRKGGKKHQRVTTRWCRRWPAKEGTNKCLHDKLVLEVAGGLNEGEGRHERSSYGSFVLEVAGGAEGLVLVMVNNS